MFMSETQTGMKGLIVLERKIFIDARGSFSELYNSSIDSDLSNINFVQDNVSISKYGVIRGLHYQLNPFAQGKLVSVLHGTVLDVAVDIRKNSPTYGKVFSIELSHENGKQLFIPRGFAHGFSVLSKEATFHYKCDQYYHSESEAGILYNDSKLNIDWQVPISDQLVSDKDLALPTWEGSKHFED